ncbi:fatty acid desaturase [Tateyamaria armeniaca]|uniref:Fatty acid desaturase n=1 Tax=Tateyamaria armeniaca TaxID=2518930 RepID=A0ABW8UWW5_9RHOB
MTHKDVLAALPAETKAALTQTDTRRGLRHLAGYLAALVLTGSYIMLQGPLWGLALLPHGILLVFLFTLSHECTHATPFSQNWINTVIGHAIAPVLVLPFVWFRYFHLAHHRHTNDPEHDPELEGGGRPTTWPDYLRYLSGWGYWSSNVRVLLRNAFGTIDASYLPERKHHAMRIEARVILAVYVLAALSLIWSPLLIWLWLVPVLIGQPVLRLYLLAEHGHCPPVADMLENTRTTLTTGTVRWLAWNMPYHAEHHSFPSVPFHRLPELHAHLAPHLKSVSDGYTEFTSRYARELGR